jgi:hypothetical protein
LLACWDDGLLNKQETPKCIFLAEHDVDRIRSAIDNGTLTNCYLCTTDGVRISNPANGCDVELDSEQSAFIEQNAWVAHLFNSGINWLDACPDMTEKMFKKMGIPASGKERAQFLEGIKNFLIMRSENPKEAYRIITNSMLLSHGKLNDPGALPLAEHSLSKFSAPHIIAEAIMKMPNREELLLLAFGDEGYPGVS